MLGVLWVVLGLGLELELGLIVVWGGGCCVDHCGCGGGRGVGGSVVALISSAALSGIRSRGWSFPSLGTNQNRSAPDPTHLPGGVAEAPIALGSNQNRSAPVPTHLPVVVRVCVCVVRLPVLVGSI